ncbi:MAG: low temperature-induced protein [Tissierellia bacterium]|nr:low temperature-induced protein [Tissierellia bacterium]
MDKKIIGVFETEQAAIRAIKGLKLNGYEAEQISVLAKQCDQLVTVEDVTDAKVQCDTFPKAGGGLLAGGVLGGIGALLLDLGLFAIPGVGPFLAAGPIAVTLTGIVAGGAIGGIAGAFIDAGLNVTDAKEYEAFLNEGKILVIVDDNDNREVVYDNFAENESINRDRLLSEEIGRNLPVEEIEDRNRPIT